MGGLAQELVECQVLEKVVLKGQMVAIRMDGVSTQVQMGGVLLVVVALEKQALEVQKVATKMDGVRGIHVMMGGMLVLMLGQELVGRLG